MHVNKVEIKLCSWKESVKNEVTCQKCGIKGTRGNNWVLVRGMLQVFKLRGSLISMIEAIAICRKEGGGGSGGIINRKISSSEVWICIVFSIIIILFISIIIRVSRRSTAACINMSLFPYIRNCRLNVTLG